MIDTQQQIQLRMQSVDFAIRRLGTAAATMDIAAFLKDADAINSFVLPQVAGIDIPNEVATVAPMGVITPA